MRKITVISMITLDGVMQAPGGSKEDLEGDFKYGGWTEPYEDEVGMEVVKEELTGKVDYLLGRKTFDIWEAYWPHHQDFWPGITDGTKYVLSKTRKTSEWENTEFIQGVEDLKKLKNSDGPDFQVWGSSQLIQLLLENDLVDELKLKTYPITLGEGKKLFADIPLPTAFKLMNTVVTETGVIIAHYKRTGEVKTGEVEV